MASSALERADLRKLALDDQEEVADPGHQLVGGSAAQFSLVRVPILHAGGAATKEVRRTLWAMYAEFVAKFRDASEQWEGRDRTAKFPVGSFPPGYPS